MKIFEFIFYKVYNFYNKRWPKNDPDIYAGLVITALIMSYILFSFYNILELFNIKFEKINLLYLPILVFSGTLNYFFLIQDDKYLKYINKDLYKHEFYKSWKCKLIVTIIFLIPILLGISFIIQVENNRKISVQ